MKKILGLFVLIAAYLAAVEAQVIISPNTSPPGAAIWGAITGTLSNQTDLQSALDAKAPLVSPSFTTPTLGVATATTLDTGQGANELYDMDQNVLQASAVTFATVDTGQGANELYDMDQNVLTTSTPQFARVGAGQAAHASAALAITGQSVNTPFDAGNSGASITIDWNNGNNQYITLTGDVAFTFSNPINGAKYSITMNTGAGTFAPSSWPATVEWQDDTAPTLSETADKVNICSFIYFTVNDSYYGTCADPGTWPE
jgi:hypothetical protein